VTAEVPEGPAAASADEPAAAGPRRARRLGVPRPDPLVVVCLLVLLGFPVACVLAAGREPVSPLPVGALAAPVAVGPGGRLVDVPALARGAVPVGAVALRRAVLRAIGALLQPADDRRLVHYLNGPPLPAEGAAGAAFPFHYAGLDALLDRALPAAPSPAQQAAIADLGALVTAGAASGTAPARTPAFNNGGQVAFAVLRRARAAGGCLPQLNFAFLVAAAADASSDDVEASFRAAERACPTNPTALWLHGQWESVAGDGKTRATAIFAQLERRFPGSAAGWSGAADALLRDAYPALDAHSPFRARAEFATALSLYGRAARLDPDPGVQAGSARARDGLGDAVAAARAQARAVAALPVAPLQAGLVVYLEHAGEFGAAAGQAGRLAAAPHFPAGPGMFIEAGDEDPSIAAEGAAAPLSLGAGRLRPVTFAIAPAQSPFPATGNVATVEDLGFIPAFRVVPGVTGYDRWCPAWSARRDLVLAGAPVRALRGMPGSFARLDDPATDCVGPDDASTLRAVAAADAAPSRPEPSAVYDERQNLWRFAGRLDRARAVDARWLRARPTDPLAYDRIGEAAFLAGDYGTAASLFGKSARLTRDENRRRSPDEADELVKRGAALKLAARYRQALDALGVGDDIASGALAAEGLTNAAADTMTLLVSYNARAQTGDVLLRQHQFADAVDAYEAAREHAPSGDTADLRIEALDNNEAGAAVYAGRPADAARSAEHAVSVDPMNPLFLETEGAAFAGLGRLADAAKRYQRAVGSDPTLFPAWNDLGVVLARMHRDGGAVAALRRAVAVRPDYAPAWFNLAIVLDRGGLRQALAAQGSLARAFRLDSGLQGRRRTLISDDNLYITGLDLSKPLPAKWSFSSSQHQAPLPAVGLAFVLLLGLQGARAAGSRGLAGGTERWLEAARALLGRVHIGLATFAPSVIAVAATIALLGWPTVDQTQTNALGLAFLGLGLLALVALVMRARVLVARHAGVAVRQRAWAPAILIAVIGAVLGVPWAPVPIAETEPAESRVHAAGPIVAAGLGLILLALDAWLQVPITQTLGVSAVVMAASMLTPVAPLDGAKMTGGAQALGGLALAGTAVLVALGLQ
jgi:tetratricopeptide (TPR) repeat protein